MTFNDFDIELKINGNELNILDLDFTVRGSIHDIYNELEIKYPDNLMIAQEFGGFLEGTIIDFSYKYDNENDQDKLKGQFVVVDRYVRKRSTPNNLGGDLHIRAVNSWYNKQRKESSAYDNRISEVIKTLLANDFSGTTRNFNDTNSADIWYRPYLTQEEMIRQILPYSQSNNSGDTPFFCFIDNYGVFQYRHLNSLLLSTPISLYAEKEGSNQHIDIIEDMQFTSTKTPVTFKNRNKNVYYENKNTGDYELENVYMYTYPTGTPKYLPIINTNSTFATNITDTFFAGEYLDDKTIEKSFNIYNTMDSYFLERVSLVLPFNPKLISGKLVKLNAKYLNEDSIYYGGNWLIERDEHYYNKDRSSGSTRVVLARSQVMIPSTYNIKSKLVNGS